MVQGRAKDPAAARKLQLDLDARARFITDEMKIAAARAIADVITDDELRPEYIIPSVFNPSVAEVVAEAVRREAERTGA